MGMELYNVPGSYPQDLKESRYIPLFVSLGFCSKPGRRQVIEWILQYISSSVSRFLNTLRGLKA